MTTVYVIEKNIPIPPSKGGAGPRLNGQPFRTLAVGDSVLFPKSAATVSVAKLQSSVSARARYYANQYGMNFTTRRVPDGVRLWRIA